MTFDSIALASPPCTTDVAASVLAPALDDFRKWLRLGGPPSPYARIDLC